MVDDAFYMELCLKEAWKYQGLTYPNPAVGAAVLDAHGKLLTIEAHHEAGKAHAELNAIAKAMTLLGDEIIETIDSPSQKHRYLLENHHDRFKNFTIYVTLEPCNHTGSTPPCSQLIQALGFKKVVIGALDPNPKASGGACFLRDSDIEVVEGVLKEACEALLLPFKKWQNNQPFVFFKLAKSANGVIGPGTITSLASREHVHALRNKIDLLAIGGNTVRTDRPILDARLVEGRSPNVLIYAKEDNFDRTIKLFDIQNRTVKIENHLESLSQYHCVMIEGGEEMLKAVLKITDYILFFTSPHLKSGHTIQLDATLERLYCGNIGCDTIEWFRKI